MRTTHKSRSTSVSTGRGVVPVKLKPGQFIFGRNKAADDLGWRPSTTWKRMLKLQDIGNIEIASNRQFSVITLCNWELYQGDDVTEGTSKEQPSDKQVTSKEQARNTNKNEKNDKNDKKKTYGEAKNVLLTDDQYQKLISKLGVEFAREKIEDLSLYLSSKNKRYKCHYSTVLAWARKESRQNDGKVAPVTGRKATEQARKTLQEVTDGSGAGKHNPFEGAFEGAFGGSVKRGNAAATDSDKDLGETTLTLP